MQIAQRETQRIRIIPCNFFRLDQVLYTFSKLLALTCSMSCLMYTVDFDRMFSKEIVDSPSPATLMKASQQITFPKTKALLFFNPHFRVCQKTFKRGLQYSALWICRQTGTKGLDLCFHSRTITTSSTQSPRLLYRSYVVDNTSPAGSASC